MRINVDIGHPAHVHYFRNAMAEWERRGHSVLVTSRDKDLTIELLDAYGIPHTCISSLAKKGFLGFAYELLVRDWRLWGLMRQFRPDVLVGVSVSIAHIGRLLGRPSLVVLDTERAQPFRMLSVPFATHMLTPSCFTLDLGKRHRRFDGYLELMYTHPNWYTPDPGVLQELGLGAGEPFFVVRFVSWEASHDVGQRGFSYEGKLRLVRELSRLGRVFITSEASLPSEFEPFRLTISPIRIHDVLYYSSLYVGEGATMASEAALLGVPSVYVNSLTAGTLKEQEQKYGLVHQVPDEERAIGLAVDVAADTDARAAHRRKRQRMLAEKTDVTAWMVDFVEGVVGR